MRCGEVCCHGFLFSLEGRRGWPGVVARAKVGLGSTNQFTFRLHSSHVIRYQSRYNYRFRHLLKTD